jgi:protein-S-isoprenylcysteine O-methyltransferase Ste14
MPNILIRTVVYASLFIAIVLVYLPAQTLARAGIVRPHGLGVAQIVGGIAVLTGAALVFWCVAAFVALGRGTPAPFDPPRHLVVRGPYRYLRNPMYLGATIALAGASLYYEAAALALYTGGFALLTHLFVVLYEEPTLAATFGSEYADYCRRVRRWWPRAAS